MTMKKMFLIVSLLAVLVMACDLSVTIVPTNGPALPPTNTAILSTDIPTSLPTLPATEVPSPIPPTVTQAVFRGLQFVVDPVSLVLPVDLPVLATSVSGSQVPLAEGQNVAPWDVTPGHIRLKLDGYFLQGKTHEPVILVYPAQAYAEMVPGAFESIRRLDNIFGNGGAPIRGEDLPTVPFFSAQPVFSSNIQPISFQNGKGVRFLTEYAQYAATANNQDLFYQFQGLTDDGAYYIIAILPIRHPALAETSDPGAVLPSGAIPYPGMTASSADMLGYYGAVTDLLTTSPQDVFTPRLEQLDMLIQSMWIID